MATPLTTETDVRNVINTACTSAQVTAFIADASVWVSEELADQNYSTDRKELIARYLTCALIRIRDLGLKSGSIGTTTESYQTDPEVTDYLLRASGFDKSGRIKKAFLDPKNSNTVLFSTGTSFTDETPVDYKIWP